MSSRFLGNSYIFQNVYIASTGTTCGPLEDQGPLSQYFDKSFDDYHCDEDSYEKAERKMLREALDICLQKAKLRNKDVDLYFGADLLNQIATTNYLAREVPKPFVGLYGACSSFCLSMAMASLMVDAGYVDKSIAMVSSHNATAERQFRFPLEYGIKKKEVTTFTATGGIATLLTNQVSDIRVESVTLGKVIDLQQNDPNDMGRAMAPAAFDTIKTHFQDLQRTFHDYDLVVTGDLSSYGHTILEEM